MLLHSVWPCFCNFNSNICMNHVASIGSLFLCSLSLKIFVAVSIVCFLMARLLFQYLNEHSLLSVKFDLILTAFVALCQVRLGLNTILSGSAVCILLLLQGGAPHFSSLGTTHNFPNLRHLGYAASSLGCTSNLHYQRRLAIPSCWHWMLATGFC